MLRIGHNKELNARNTPIIVKFVNNKVKFNLQKRAKLR